MQSKIERIKRFIKIADLKAELSALSRISQRGSGKLSNKEFIDAIKKLAKREGIDFENISKARKLLSSTTQAGSFVEKKLPTFSKLVPEKVKEVGSDFVSQKLPNFIETSPNLAFLGARTGHISNPINKTVRIYYGGAGGDLGMLARALKRSEAAKNLHPVLRTGVGTLTNLSDIAGTITRRRHNAQAMKFIEQYGKNLSPIEKLKAYHQLRNNTAAWEAGSFGWNALKYGGAFKLIKSLAGIG